MKKIMENWNKYLEEQTTVTADTKKGTATVGTTKNVGGGTVDATATTGKGGTQVGGTYEKGGTKVGASTGGRSGTRVTAQHQVAPGTKVKAQYGGGDTKITAQHQVAPGTKVQAQAGGGDTKVAAQHTGTTAGGTKYNVGGQVGGKAGTHVQGQVSGKRGEGTAKVSRKGVQAAGRVKTGKDSEVRGDIDTGAGTANIGGEKTFRHKGGGKTRVSGDVGTAGAAGEVEHTTAGGTTVGAKGKIPSLMRRKTGAEGEIYAKRGGFGGYAGYGGSTGFRAGARGNVGSGLQAQLDYDQRGRGAGSGGRISGRLQHDSGVYAQGSAGLGKGGGYEGTVGYRGSFQENIYKEEYEKLLQEVGQVYGLKAQQELIDLLSEQTTTCPEGAEAIGTNPDGSPICGPAQETPPDPVGYEPGTEDVSTPKNVPPLREVPAAPEAKPEEIATPEVSPETPPAEKPVEKKAVVMKSWDQKRRDVNAAYKSGKITKAEWRKERRALSKVKPGRRRRRRRNTQRDWNRVLRRLRRPVPLELQEPRATRIKTTKRLRPVEENIYREEYMKLIKEVNDAIAAKAQEVDLYEN